MGLRPLAGVGHLLPAAAAQLRRRIPRIRSERPAFDLHHPEVAAMDQPSPDKGVLDHLLGEPELEPEHQRPEHR